MAKRGSIIYRNYKLSQPDTKQPAYFGFTSHPVEKRLLDHVHESRNKRGYYSGDRPVLIWIANLLRLNHLPIVTELLQTSDLNEAKEYEEALITHARLNKIKILNISDGGLIGLHTLKARKRFTEKVRKEFTIPSVAAMAPLGDFKRQMARLKELAYHYQGTKRIAFSDGNHFTSLENARNYYELFSMAMPPLAKSLDAPVSAVKQTLDHTIQLLSDPSKLVEYEGEVADICLMVLTNLDKGRSINLMKAV